MRLLYMKGKAIRYSVRIGARMITLLMSLNSFQSSSLQLFTHRICTMKTIILLVRVFDKRLEFRSSRNSNVESFCSEE